MLVVEVIVSISRPFLSFHLYYKELILNLLNTQTRFFLQVFTEMRTGKSKKLVYQNKHVAVFISGDEKIFINQRTYSIKNGKKIASETQYYHHMDDS